MTTLVYHTGALGDFVTTLPAIRYWRRSHPQDRIILLGKPVIGAVATTSGYVDEIWDVESLRFSALFSKASVRTIRGLLTGVDRVICFAGSDSPLLSNIRRSGIGEIYSQDPFPPSRRPKYEYHLALFKDRIDPADRSVPLIVTPSDLADPRAGRFVTVHPGSGSPFKNWPLQRFVDISQRLSLVGCDVLWLLGPAESALHLPPTAAVLRDAALLDLLSAIGRCCLYIGNDSGVSHCAAALGRPSVVLFGPSDPVVWRPLGHRVSIVSAARNRGPCHGNSAEDDPGGTCMQAITVEQVWREILRALPRRCRTRLNHRRVTQSSK